MNIIGPKSVNENLTEKDLVYVWPGAVESFKHA